MVTAPANLPTSRTRLAVDVNNARVDTFDVLANNFGQGFISPRVIAEHTHQL